MAEVGLEDRRGPLLQYFAKPPLGEDALSCCDWQVGAAREFDIDPTAVTRLIDRLVRSGLLMRTPNALDRRVSRLVLTRQGQIVAGHMPGILTDVYSKVLAGFSVDEVASFMEMLRRILSS